MTHLEPNGTYRCIYRIDHPSQGLADGDEVIALLFDRQGVRDAYSLRDGHRYPSDAPVPGWETIHRKILSGYTDPSTIAHPDHATTTAGDGAVIDIVRCTRDDANQTQIDDERMTYLKDHQALWDQKRHTDYRFVLMDSRLKKEHPNGIEITVRGGKAIQAVDVWSGRTIERLPDVPFTTIDEAYGWLHNCVDEMGIAHLVIDYDDACGSPRYIRCTPVEGARRTVSIVRCKEI